jgi:hypothetical protein
MPQHGFRHISWQGKKPSTIDEDSSFLGLIRSGTQANSSKLCPRERIEVGEQYNRQFKRGEVGNVPNVHFDSPTYFAQP